MQSAPVIDPQRREDLSKRIRTHCGPFFLMVTVFNQVQQEPYKISVLLISKTCMVRVKHEFWASFNVKKMAYCSKVTPGHYPKKRKKKDNNNYKLAFTRTYSPRETWVNLTFPVKIIINFVFWDKNSLSHNHKENFQKEEKKNTFLVTLPIFQEVRKRYHGRLLWNGPHLLKYWYLTWTTWLLQADPSKL